MDHSMVLYRTLSDLGDFVDLRPMVDIDRYRKQIEPLEASFRQYNPRKPEIRRLGLSLTSLDGQSHGEADLDSLVEYNREHGTQYSELSFKTPTLEFDSLTCLHQIRDLFNGLGRSHILRFQAGGFFPPHRDGKPTKLSCFRILVPLTNVNSNNMVFGLDDRILRFVPGRAYFINTIKTHYLFSFTDKCDMAVFNVELTIDNVDAVLNNLLAR